MKVNVMMIVRSRWTNLSGDDERGHDAHVRRQKELQTHNKHSQHRKGHQLQDMVHQLTQRKTEKEKAVTRV